VHRVEGVWTASINPEVIPRVHVNRRYAGLVKGTGDSGGAPVSQQLREARWLVRNIAQRFETIQRVSQAIVDRQRQFFEHGEVAMRPLVLREIAEVLDLHESTVSRVTTQKFMLTPRGIFELKYFFGSHVSTESGGSCSATAIRALIRQLVGSEDTRKPLSDSQIADILGKQGIVVARRTIAKYRESLQILPVNLRKTI
jgi:RNA polymerase sigma-54 factor